MIGLAFRKHTIKRLRLPEKKKKKRREEKKGGGEGKKKTFDKIHPELLAPLAAIINFLQSAFDLAII